MLLGLFKFGRQCYKAEIQLTSLSQILLPPPPSSLSRARALRRARTEVEVGAGLKHPLVPYLEFKASCAAKAAARHTKTINSSVEDD